MNRTEEDPHLALGAYVLHALPPRENAAFERHLATCAACRREVGELREAVVSLSDSDATELPPGLRERVFARVAHTPQEHVPAPKARTVPLRRRALMPALAASVAVSVALGGVSAWQYSRAEDADARAAAAQHNSAAVAGVLTAPDAAVHTGKLTDGTDVAVVVSRDSDKAAFVASGLPALGEGKVYELWYAADSGDLSPAGLLPGSGGRPARVLDRPLAGAVAVGITVEPAGGSSQPTTDPLGVIPIAV